LLQLLGETQNLLRLGGRGEDEFHREISAAGQRGRRDHEQSGFRAFGWPGPAPPAVIWKTVRFRSPHGLSTMPQNPLSGKVSWNICSFSGILANSRASASV
jgi:hypothetical protein